MSNEKSFAESLLYYRSRAGLSQEELANKSGVSKVQIAKYETNKSTPRLKAIMKLAKALNVSIEDLGYTPRKKIVIIVPMTDQKPWWDQVTGVNLSKILIKHKVNVDKADLTNLHMKANQEDKEIEISFETN